MISVEQIRLLETKVQQAVSLLSNLQEENRTLRGRLGKYEERIDELEFLIEEFKEEQSEIEQGILSALNQLNELNESSANAKKQDEISEEPKNSESVDPPSKKVENHQEAKPLPENGSSTGQADLEESIEGAQTIPEDTSGTQSDVQIPAVDTSTGFEETGSEQDEDVDEDEYHSEDPNELDLF
jgi:chromosome segregation ATPase